jgi:hypothetical protein
MTLINFWFAKKPPYVRNDARKGNVHETLIDRYLLLFQNPTFHGRIARISFLGGRDNGTKGWQRQMYS